MVKDNTPLRYKIDLASSGFRDGPPDGASTVERAQKLAEYRAAWDANAIPHCIVSPPNGFHLHTSSSSDGVFIYSDNDSMFWIHAPASILMGVPEQSRFVDLGALFEEKEFAMNTLGSCVVDVAQDLVLVTRLVPDE